MPVFSTALGGMKLCGLTRVFQRFLPGFLARNPCTCTCNVWPTWHERVAQIHPLSPWTSAQRQCTPAWGVEVPCSPGGKDPGNPNQCSPVACRDTAAPLAPHFAFCRDAPLAPKPCGQTGAGPCILGLPGPCTGDSPSPPRWHWHSLSLQASGFQCGQSVFQLQRSPREGGSRCGLFPLCRVEVIVCCLGHCGGNRWENAMVRYLVPGWS